MFTFHSEEPQLLRWRLPVCQAEQRDSGAVRPSGRLQETTCQPGSPSSRTLLGGTRQHSGDAHGTCFLAQRMAWNPQQEGSWPLSGSSLESRRAMVTAKGAQSSHSSSCCPSACDTPCLCCGVISRCCGIWVTFCVLCGLWNL